MVKALHGNDKINTNINRDSYYTSHKEAFDTTMVPHCMFKYFLRTSFKTQHLVNFLHGYMKKFILRKFPIKFDFTNMGINGKQDVVIKKFHLNMKVYMVKKVKKNDLVWLVDPYHGVMMNKIHHYIKSAQG